MKPKIKSNKNSALSQRYSRYRYISECKKIRKEKFQFNLFFNTVLTFSNLAILSNIIITELCLLGFIAKIDVFYEIQIY